MFLLLNLISAVNVFPSAAKRESTLIPTSCFNSQSSLQSCFDYNYPWGDTHNGAAIMSEPYVVASNGLTLTSVYTGASKYPYNSGTICTKQQFTVPSGGGLTFSAEFNAPTVRGTWPAFWLTGADSWPPEIDMAEWKGDGDVLFNTFNTSSQVASYNIPWSSGSHTVTAELRDAGSNVVSIQFLVDGASKTTQHGNGIVCKPFWLVIDFQMEGSSGSPGPTTSGYLGASSLSAFFETDSQQTLPTNSETLALSAIKQQAPCDSCADFWKMEGACLL